MTPLNVKTQPINVKTKPYRRKYEYDVDMVSHSNTVFCVSMSNLTETLRQNGSRFQNEIDLTVLP